jgi:phosphoglycolate phosphatase
MTIRGVLFDKDGTLFDFRTMWLPAYRAAAEWLAAAAGDPGLAGRLLAAGGYDVASGRLDAASPLAGGTIEAIVALWRSEPGLARIDGAAGRVQEILRIEAGRAARPVTDLAALFGGLRRRGLRLGVATTDATASAHDVLARFAVTSLIDFVAGFDAGFGAKPDPGLVHAFCARTGLTGAEVAVVGDSLVDMTMARDAGAGLKVGVLTGVTSRETLEGVADHVLGSVAELDRLLDRAE